MIFCFTGDLLDIYVKGENSWWFGELNGKTGHFPSTYVEELPVLSKVKSSDAWPTWLMNSKNTKSDLN